MKFFVFCLTLLATFVVSLYGCGGPPEIVREPLPPSRCCGDDGGSEVGGSTTPPPSDAALVTAPQFGSVLVVVKIDDQEYVAVCGGEVSFVPATSDRARTLLKLQRTP